MTQDNSKTGIASELINDESTLEDVLNVVAKAIDDKKGEDIRILNVSASLDYLDYIVICTGTTEIQNRAIADSIKEQMTRCDIIPERLHGYNHGKWILLDFDILVVHIFTPDLREYYRLEDLWAGGSEVNLT